MAAISLQTAYDQARQLLEENHSEHAIAMAHHILEYFPDNLEAYRILGEAYLANRQLDQAETAFTRVLHSDPDNIPAHVGLGITYERQGKSERAVSEFEQALEIRPDMAELRSQLLRLYTEVWGNEHAMLRLSRSGLARLYAKGHMFPQAIQEFRSVLDESPNRLDARIGLAESLWRDGQEEKAVAECQSILTGNNEVLKANLLLGYIKLAGGDPEGERYWRIAQQLEPYQAVANAVFDTLPDLSEPNVTLPEWDQAAWEELREREARERQAEEEARQAREEEARIAVAASSTVQTEEDSFFGGAWIDAINDSQKFEGAAGLSSNDDDFLASLLAMAEQTEEEQQPSGSAASAGPAKAPDVDLEEPDLKPFSLEDLGLTADEITAIHETSETSEKPESLETTIPAAASDEADLKPFSLQDLGLSEEEISALDSLSETGVSSNDQIDAESLDSRAEIDKASMQPASPDSTEAEPQPFSLDDIGLPNEDLTGFQEPDQPAETVASQGSADEDLLGIEPFDWSIVDSSQTQTNVSDVGVDQDTLGNVQPFSLESLDLDQIESLNSGSLPPSLQPFSLENTDEATSAPPSSTDIGLPLPGEIDAIDHTKTYSWQEPSAKQQPDFLRQESASNEQEPSIFAKLKKRREQIEADDEIDADEALPLPAASSEDMDIGGLAFFSGDNVSLRDDEVAIESDIVAESPELSAETPKPEFAAEEEPEIKPLSLAELGLSDDEIASLSFDEAAASAPEAPPIAEEEPEIKPLSLAELGLSDDEIASLGLDEADAPAPETPKARGEALPDFSEEGLQPFSFDDLDFGDEGLSLGSIASPDSEERRLGLTKEELENLHLGEFEQILTEQETSKSQTDVQRIGTGPLASLSQEEEALERLLHLGQDQGFVDLTDIIGVVSDPESEAERIEEIAWAIHRAGIELRDGNEIIDLEAEEESVEASAELIEETPAPQATTPYTPPAAEVEPDLTPFSLDDLGLSEQEISELGLDSAVSGPPTDIAEEEEPEIKPLTLAELGLSEEETAALNAASADIAPPESAPEPVQTEKPEDTETPHRKGLKLSAEEIEAIESAAAKLKAETKTDRTQQPSTPATPSGDIDEFDFDIVDQQPAEAIAPAKRTTPRPPEEPKPLSPEDAAFVPESLESLDNVWNISTPTAQPEIVQKPEESAPAQRRPTPPEPPAQRETPSTGTSRPPRDEKRAETRPQREAPRASLSARTTSGKAKIKSLAEFVPTGDEMLDAYLNQLEAEPENHALGLSVARIGGQTGRYDLMMWQYKHMIKEGQLVDQIVEEIEELVADVEDPSILRQLYRMLGDAYSKQNRFREAIDAYSHTFAG